MHGTTLSRQRLWITVAITVATWMLLVWEHLQGGVASHHLLHRGDLPAVSNWWGGIVLPALTWALLGRIHARSADRREAGRTGAFGYSRSTVIGFVGGLGYGVVLATTFTLGYATVTTSLFQALLLLALVLPIHRAESLLGFVLGMTSTFGAVLPALVGSVVAGIAAMLHLYLRPPLARLASRLIAARTSPAG